MTEQLSEYFYFHCKEVICPFCLDPWPEYVCTKKNLQNIHFFQRKLGHLLKKSMVMQCKSSLTICMWNECRLNVNTDMILLIFNFVLTKTVFYTVFIQFFVFLVGWGFFFKLFYRRQTACKGLRTLLTKFIIFLYSLDIRFQLLNGLRSPLS